MQQIQLLIQIFAYVVITSSFHVFFIECETPFVAPTTLRYAHMGMK